MIDIHSHIVWGVDDGARDREQSLAMLKMAAEAGTTDIVATPHADHQFKFDPKLVAERILDLGEATGNVPRIHRGCDLHMSLENINAVLKDPTPFTINGHCYLMVEFADAFVPPSTDEVLRQFVASGIVPVVTHPERNPILQGAHKRLESWIELGCLMQVTAQCLTDRFGAVAQKAAWELLRKGMVHVIASDAHDTQHRPPRLDQAREILTKDMGSEAAALLLDENPGAIIAGERRWIQAPVALAVAKKKWWFF